TRYGELPAAGRILPSFRENFRLFEDLRKRLRDRSLLLLAHLPQTDGWETARQIELPVRETPAYHNNKNALAEDLRSFKRQRMRVFFAASNPLRLSRLEEIVKELDFPGVELLLCPLNKGFVSAGLGLAVITEKELLGQETRRAARRPAHKGERIDNFLDLRQGDFVVHVNHGVGRYMGVERLLVGETQRDYLYIQYAGQDKLFLPADQLDLIHKYIGNENAPPKLYRLGGGEWQRVKAKVSRDIQDIAKELLQLYAAREASRGHSFSPDSHWQREFEDSFPFEETADQLSAMEEIKADMENARPMDRLLCGDVGYGKTELAVRAAFKAVMDGKQAAMLAPTTVLAEQHYRTFCQRFAGYPVAIGVLSRFLGPKEQKLSLDKLKEGGLDIIIGTHRLLSQDVKFHDLGLLIVDEEQRFGVSHKEKIKKMKTNLDVLTLSATPIPRTLHMSLVGMRDMSLITTPPQDRHPVQTYVLEYQERLIKDALERELKRGGQAYFVHNKVYNIERTTERLQALLPKARILTAHGQMREKELEQVMKDFVEGEADILVCTTIVESGLDIPNVNTLIVDEAENFGLAQLYQLRGRVGRSDRQAFAYFTYRPNRIMNETAKKRLVAIRDFSDLGSGFKIAMRDMEIRGAGNILGAEQHGHIAAVGFDLYCRLVQEEIESQKGREPQAKEPVTLLELQVNAYTPDSYIDDMGLKLNIYKRIAAAPSLQYIDELRAELTERCGPPPTTVENLLELGKIKLLAQKLFVVSITQKPGFLELKFAAQHPLSGEVLRELAVKWNKRIVFSQKEDFVIRLKTDANAPGEPMALLLEFLSSLAVLCGVRAEI
ncbi:MAG: transcription-repair coupling factor, partial [Clostridiales bacterium]|nr:transcription-repair coupling factor [Clostridiales bacterium]